MLSRTVVAAAGNVVRSAASTTVVPATVAGANYYYCCCCRYDCCRCTIAATLPLTATVVVPVTQRRQMDWSNLVALPPLKLSWLLPMRLSSIVVAVDFVLLEWTVDAFVVVVVVVVVVAVE